ncbi:MAG: hypothetical protein AB7P40_00335 [Chloroflexota bacterium]
MPEITEVQRRSILRVLVHTYSRMSPAGDISAGIPCFYNRVGDDHVLTVAVDDPLAVDDMVTAITDSRAVLVLEGAFVVTTERPNRVRGPRPLLRSVTVV